MNHNKIGNTHIWWTIDNNSSFSGFLDFVTSLCAAVVLNYVYRVVAGESDDKRQAALHSGA